MESLGQDFCVCGGGGWGVAAWGKLFDWRMCKNI